MSKVIYTQPDGSVRERETPHGAVLLWAALAGGIDGLVADCGGTLGCGTCHVIVEEPFASRLPPPVADEDDLLDYTVCPREPGSRLACQLVMDDALDGMRVRIAQRQL